MQLPDSIILHNCSVFIKIKKLTLVHCYLLSNRIYPNFASFFKYMFLLSQDSILYTTSHLVSRPMPSTCISSSAFIFSNLAPSEKLLLELFVECPLIWICLVIPYCESGVTDFGGQHKERWSALFTVS